VRSPREPGPGAAQPTESAKHSGHYRAVGMGGRALQQQTRGVSGSSGQKSSRQSRVAKGPLAARQRKKEKFTALLHQISPEHLEAAFFELKENTAPGVDGLTWRAYEEGLDAKILDLHSRLHKRWTVGNAPIRW